MSSDKPNDAAIGEPDQPTRNRRSAARTRPTRAQTRSRLFEAAAVVFADKGIAAATIEDICAEAGFSRGAFYSNFGAKDELVIELLEEHLTANLAEIDRLFDESADPGDFIQSMESERRRRDDYIAGNGLLYIELMLYALRNPDNRPRMVERQNRSYDKTRQILRKIEAESGAPLPGPIDDMAALILAFDDGLMLHQLIDPGTVRPRQFAETMAVLYRLWLTAEQD